MKRSGRVQGVFTKQRKGRAVLTRNDRATLKAGQKAGAELRLGEPDLMTKQSL